MDPNTKPEFVVKGNLYSMGTAVNPVKITGPAETRKPDSWGRYGAGILATPTCTEMLLDHTIIELWRSHYYRGFNISKNGII